MEYRALRDVSRGDIRLYSIVEVLLQTGIRIGELAALTIDDIRKSKEGVDFLYIKSIRYHPARKVPLNKSAKKAIDAYLEIRPETEDDTLYVTKNGRPLLVRNIRTAIDKAFEKASIKNAKVNDLRNTFIAHHFSKGCKLSNSIKISWS
jgi:site-specific recombinase XerD